MCVCVTLRFLMHNCVFLTAFEALRKQWLNLFRFATDSRGGAVTSGLSNGLTCMWIPCQRAAINCVARREVQAGASRITSSGTRILGPSAASISTTEAVLTRDCSLQRLESTSDEPKTGWTSTNLSCCQTASLEAGCDSPPRPYKPTEWQTNVN